MSCGKWSVEYGVRLLAEAAELGASFINNPHTEVKKDRTLVTLADKTVENFLTGELEDEKNSICLIGEETISMRSREYVDKALRNTTWIIDPIDGTAMFAHNIPLWGVSIGLAENGIIVDGGVICPCTGEVLISCEGKSYYANVSASPKKDGQSYLDALVQLSPPAEQKFSVSSAVGLSQKFTGGGHTSCVNPLNTFCSTVYEAVLLATGRHFASVTSAKLWDHAGSLAALKNLDFAARTESGRNVMTLAVDPEIYDLAPDAKSPFAFRERVVIAPNEDAVKEIREKFVSA